MPIICSNPQCKHANVEGTSYCVRCGKLLGGMKVKKVVIKEDYDKMSDKIKSLELEKKRLDDRILTLTNTDKARVEQIKRQQSYLDDINKKGSAPAGYTLINNGALKEERENASSEISKLKKELENIKSKGYAPSGFHLEKDKTWYERIANKTISTREYNSLVARANMPWWGKLWDSMKNWWNDTGIVILAWLVSVVVICAFIWYFMGYLFSSCSNNNSEVIKIEQRNGLWGIAKGDDIILSFEYDSIVKDKFDTIYSRIYKNENVGLVMTATGKQVVPCIYRNVGNTDNISLRGKLIAVQKDDGKWNYVDYSGNPTKYKNLIIDYAAWWNDAEMGIVGVKINGDMRYGFVDSSGYIKINCKYAEVHNFFEGLALVKKNKYGPWICINAKGEEQYTLKYALCDIYQDSLMAVSNYYAWKANSYFGFVDRKGNLVIDMYYTPWILNDDEIMIPRFYDGKAQVHYEGKNGRIDKFGKFTPEQ